MDVLAGVSEESRRMITALEMTGGFRVLRRFQPLTKFADYESEQARAKAKLAMVVRSRATGSNPGRDKLLELGYVVVRFSAETGTVYEVDSVYAGTEAAAAVPEAALRAAGLTAQVVRGTAFDEARVNADAERCVVVICLNAETERHFLEARFPVFATKWFSSAKREAPWLEFNAEAPALGVLASSVGGYFLDATPVRPALLEAQVLVDLLARRTPDGAQVLRRELDASRVPSWRVWAVDVGADHKRALFERGYRWNDGASEDKPIKGWQRLVESLDAELAFLGAAVYAEPMSIPVEKVTGLERYSDRQGEVNVIPVVSTTGTPAGNSPRPEAGAGQPQPGQRSAAPAVASAAKAVAAAAPSSHGRHEQGQGTRGRERVAEAAEPDFPI
ncbi:hypothetical protein [Ottowia sp.]|uniref:hypothetical protein n=1 Tax=Ottowia sp. TaxID=1898956 RepID=UPI0025F42755|nr:hypothetical protein [Ottowia sp.]MBK6616689.1 hypothetical protein [Ottowia sp.]